MSTETESNRLVHTDIAVNIQAKVHGYHHNVIQEIIQHVENDDVVVIGMAWNPFVIRARKALNNANLQHTYLEYGSYISAWKPRLAIKMWSGWPTFPQVFINGTLVGGATDVESLIQSGKLQQILAEK